MLHQLVTILKLDIRYKVIRFENEWHYYFTGRILYEADFKSNKKGKVLSVNVDLVVNDGSEGNKMISGYLTQYTISPKTGQLDLICLTSAKRWSKRQRMLVDVPGDCFIVPYEKVVDFNLTYNMPVINQGRRAKVFNTLSMLGFIVIIFATFYPWFLNLSIFKKFLSSIFLTASTLWFLLFLLNNFQPNPSSKLKISGLIMCLILFVIFGWLAIINMNLQTGIYQFLQHIYYSLPFTNLSK